MKKLVFIGLVVAVLAGCQSVPLKVPTVLEKQYEVLGDAEASAVGIMLFNVIPLGQNQRLERAYKDAIYSKNGDALINPIISERWFWAYVLNGYVTTVKGTVIKYKQ